MSIINSILESNLVATGLCTLVLGSESAAPMNIAGNILECTVEKEMLQTAAKILQSVNTAFLAVWATFSIADLLEYTTSWEHYEVVSLTATVAGTLVLSIPFICLLVKNLSPENKEKIENFQRSYSTTLKIINIIASGIVLCWFISSACACCGTLPITSILLSAGSVISSVYTLQRSI